ncbi:MAG: ABC transporter transmembrane domain-containing protein, partial [Balneolales bacterium]
MNKSIKKVFRLLSSPAYRLIFETIKANHLLIYANIGTNLISVLLEGGSIGLVYIATSSLTSASSQAIADKINLPLITNLLEKFQLAPLNIFLSLVLIAVILQCLQSIFNYFNKVVTAQISAKAQTSVTQKVFERIMTLSYSCVSSYKVGDLVMYANDAALAVDRQIEEVNSLIINTVFSVAYVLIVIKLSALLSIAAAIIVLIAALLQYSLVPRLRAVAARVTHHQVEIAKDITESIQGLHLIHVYGTQQKTIQKVRSVLQSYQKNLIERSFVYYLSEPILD